MDILTATEELIKKDATNGNGFKTDKEKLEKYLTLWKHRINFQDYDFFCVVVGKERRGKSTLALHIAKFLSNENMKIENICLDLNEFITSLQKAKKGDIIILDEAGTNLYSREAMSAINRSLTKAFMVSGMMNIGIILCLPSFFNLDTYIRTHRVDLLLLVPVRAKIKAYSHKRARIIALKGAKEKSYTVTKPITVGWFRKYNQDDALYKLYREKEMKFKTGYIGSIQDTISGMISTTKFAELLGVTVTTVYRYIRDKKIKARKVGKKYFIPKAELERMAENFDTDAIVNEEIKEEEIS